MARNARPDNCALLNSGIGPDSWNLSRLVRGRCQWSQDRCHYIFAQRSLFNTADNWTVVLVLDGDDRVVAFKRVQQTAWDRIQTIIGRFADRYEPNTVALDGTRDNKIVEDIEKVGYHVDPIRFSSRKKRTLIEDLITELETGRITPPASANTLLNKLEMMSLRGKKAVKSVTQHRLDSMTTAWMHLRWPFQPRRRLQKPFPALSDSEEGCVSIDGLVELTLRI